MNLFKHCSSVFLLICGLGISESAWATRWANQFVEFELPAQWECSLEGAEWVCQNTD